MNSNICFLGYNRIDAKKIWGYLKYISINGASYYIFWGDRNGKINSRRVKDFTSAERRYRKKRNSYLEGIQNKELFNRIVTEFEQQRLFQKLKE